MKDYYVTATIEQQVCYHVVAENKEAARRVITDCFDLIEEKRPYAQIEGIDIINECLRDIEEVLEEGEV